MVGTLAVLACDAYLILCSALAGSCVGGLDVVTRMRECMCGGAVFIVLANFIDRLYRQLCYEISANGNPGVIQSAWLWCKYSRVYNALINAIVWLHLINAFLEAPLTYSSASSAGRVINIVVAVILLVHGSMSLYWRLCRVDCCGSESRGDQRDGGARASCVYFRFRLWLLHVYHSDDVQLRVHWNELRLRSALQEFTPILHSAMHSRIPRLCLAVVVR